MSGLESGPTRPERFFEDALQQFRDIAAPPGAVVSRQFLLAGRTVRIDASAGGMEQALLPAFAHLAESNAPEPDLIIHAWDSESNAAPPLKPQWGIDDYRREGFIAGFNNSRFLTAVQFDPPIFRMVDLDQRRALYWTPSAARLSVWERGAPLRPLLHGWLNQIGLLAIHGGAVGFPDGGVFLAGASGQGKSNVALSCLNSDLVYASDDFCVLSHTNRWIVHSLYCTGKMAPGDLARHPHLRGAEINPNPRAGDKMVYFLNEKFNDRLVQEMPLRAIVLPRITAQGPSRIVPVAPALVQRVIILSTIGLARWTGHETFARVVELIRDLPCYELIVGESMADVPATIAQLLSDLRQAPPNGPR
jgi:hypothetical protein